MRSRASSIQSSRPVSSPHGEKTAIRTYRLDCYPNLPPEGCHRPIDEPPHIPATKPAWACMGLSVPPDPAHCSSPALLTGLGDLAREFRPRGCWVQSHLAESHDEMAFVEALHPGKRDAEIFDAAGTDPALYRIPYRTGVQRHLT